MRRRHVLALLAAVAGAGCVADSAPGTKPADSTPPADTDDGATDSPASDPFETVRVGSREDVTETDDNRPHTVSVTNEGSTREIGVRIARATGGRNEPRAVLDETYEFPVGGTLLVKLLEPERYTVEVRVPGSEQATSFVVGTNWFDCNYSAHRVTVPASGPIAVTNVSTTMACVTPTVRRTAATNRTTRSPSGSETRTERSDRTVTETNSK